MRRFTGILTLSATALSLFAAQAQQTYTQNLDFQATNQSMWNASLGQAGYSYDLPLTQTWDTHGNKRSNHYHHVFILGTFGAGATVNSTGQVGLDLNAYATSGSVDADYPLTLNLNYPDPSTLAPGQTFTLTSSYTVSPNATLATHSPDAGVIMHAHLQSDPMKIFLNVEAF